MNRQGVGVGATLAAVGWAPVTVLCLGVWLHAADSLLAATVMPSAVAEIGGLAFIYWAVALYQLGSILENRRVQTIHRAGALVRLEPRHAGVQRHGRVDLLSAPVH